VLAWVKLLHSLIFYNNHFSNVAAYQVKGKSVMYDLVSRLNKPESKKAINISVDEEEL